jgi:hypothetical protein
MAAIVAAGCDDDPTTAVVENGYAIPSDARTADADPMTVFKVWWVTTLFATPVPPGELSETERTTPANDFAYALLAPGWSPELAGAPARLIAVRSKQPLSVAAHDLLRITVSDDQFTGNCAAGAPLGADDARFIVERIFPGELAGTSYDPATCTSLPVAADGGAGVDGAADGATD